MGARGVRRLLLVLPRLRLPTSSGAAKGATPEGSEDALKAGKRAHGTRGAEYGVWVRPDVRPPPSEERIGEIVTRITSAYTAPDLEAAIHEVTFSFVHVVL